VIPKAHQNVSPKARARALGPGGRPPDVVASATLWERMTASRAVPTDPPTRWMTFSCGLASWISSGRSTANAAAMDGIIDDPTPTPRATRVKLIKTYEVWAPMNTRGRVNSEV